MFRGTSKTIYHSKRDKFLATISRVQELGTIYLGPLNDPGVVFYGWDMIVDTVKILGVRENEHLRPGTPESDQVYFSQIENGRDMDPRTP